MKDRNLIRKIGLMLAGLVLALLAAAYVPTAVAAPPACDCSCAAHRQLEERGAGMAAKAEQAFNGGDMSAFMAMAKTFGRCMQQCMQPWQQCEAQAEAEQQTRGREAAEKAAAEHLVERLGAPRDDLERFFGAYQGDNFRILFQPALGDYHGAPIPPGYMVIRSSHGDGAPLYMRSVGDSRFEGVVTWGPVVAEFAGGAVVMHGAFGGGRFSRVQTK